MGHGTHVAGLACGEGNNGVGIAGAAFACKLIDEKVTDTETIGDSLIAEAITDATDHGADVISMSFGGPGASGVINHALDYAFSHDVVLVAAASNRHTTQQGAPASHLQPNGTGPKIGSGKGLVVTAAGHNDRRAWFHPGHGTGISLAAYGSASGACEVRTRCGIFSPFPDNDTKIEQGDPSLGVPGCGHCRASFQGSSDFAYLEGTSMATPQVARAAALIRSKRPQIKNTSVLRILKRTANGPRFRDSLGWGILNAGRALKRAVRLAALCGARVGVGRLRLGLLAGRLRSLGQLGDRALDPLGDQLEVVHRVVVRQQAEVDAAVVAHDRHEQGLVRRQEADREDVLAARGPARTGASAGPGTLVTTRLKRRVEKLIRAACASSVGGAKSLKRVITSAPSACLDCFRPASPRVTVRSRRTGSSM